MSSQVDNLFQQAYGLAFVENDYEKAIVLCRQILEFDSSHHMARMLLGTLLADSSSSSEIEEAKTHFVYAVQNAKSMKDFFTGWEEENPIFQLGLWEMNKGHQTLACLFFLLDALIQPAEGTKSQGYLEKLLDNEDLAIRSIIYTLINRFHKEYKLAKLENEGCN